MTETLVEQEQNTDVLERADDIMDKAVTTAGDLVVDKPECSEVILKQLLKVDPEHLSGLQMLGLCKHRMGDNVEAVEIIQTALDLDPTNTDNWNNMALAYGALGNQNKAIDCLKKALEYKPDHHMYLNNLGLQYRSINKYEEAIEALTKAVEIEPAPQILVNLGGVYGEMRQVGNAIQCFDFAVKLQPDYSPAHVDLTFAHALMGRWETAFDEYEWRFSHYPQLDHYKNEYDQDKLWNGKDSLEDKKILIYCEQGAGDAIQFVRYLKQLKSLGATVYVHCAASLNNLFERIESIDRVVNRDIVHRKGAEFPEYDYQCAIMSLPHLLKDFEPCGESYLTPATDKFRKYLHEEYGEGTFNVGIVWAGSPAHPNDKLRSVPLKLFKPLQEIKGVKLFSLQVDVRKRVYGSQAHPEEAAPSKFQETNEIIDYCEGADDVELTDLTVMIQDFEDTATILSGLDLLICCDTATMHLAGALGVPTWGLIAYNPDWRWLLDGDTTNWYDSVKLFRQTERDNWEQVLEKVQEELHEVVLQAQRQEL